MDASSSLINLGKNVNVSDYRTLAIQLLLTDLVVATDGTFQLMVSNDGTNFTPVPDRGGITYKAVVSGNGTTSFFIFVDESVAGAEFIGLKYTRVGGTGKLAYVYISGTPT